MKSFLLCLLLLAISTDVQAQGRILFRLTAGGAVVGHALDTATTMFCRGEGSCTEANPWLARYQNPIPFATGKTVVAVGSIWATAAIYDRCENPRCKWAAIGLNVAQTVGFTWIAIRNDRFRRQGRP